MIIWRLKGRLRAALSICGAREARVRSGSRDVNKELVAAVATVIGCPEWTCDGCDRTDECFCEQAAEGVKRLLSEGSRKEE
jgi:hypothetical protein